MANRPQRGSSTETSSEPAALSVAGEPVMPPAMPVDEHGVAIPNVRALKGVIYDATFHEAGVRFYMRPEDFAEREAREEIERL